MLRRGITCLSLTLLAALGASVTVPAGALPPKPPISVPPKPPLRAAGTSTPAPPPAAAASATGAGNFSQHLQQMTALVQKDVERQARGNPLAKPRRKKSLAELRRGGLEQPKPFAKPAQRRSNLRSPQKRGVTQPLVTEHVAAMTARVRRYVELEAKASSAVKTKVAALRTSIAQQKKSFEVGVTSVSDRPLKEITGFVGKLDLKLAKAQKAKRESRRGKPNLVRETMRERATPPPSAPDKKNEHRDPTMLPS